MKVAFSSTVSVSSSAIALFHVYTIKTPSMEGLNFVDFNLYLSRSGVFPYFIGDISGNSNIRLLSVNWCPYFRVELFLADFALLGFILEKQISSLQYAMIYVCNYSR